MSSSPAYDVLLDNGARLRLSRRYRKELQSRLGIPGVRASKGKSSVERNREDV
jgi:hypothetical protein